MRVLWLTPDKPENISVGRRRIADHLGSEGVDVTLRGTNTRTVLRSLIERSQYDVVVGTTRAGAFGAAAISLVSRAPLVVDHVDPIRQFRATNPDWLSRAVEVAENVTFRLSDATLFVYEEERDRVAARAPVVVSTALGMEFQRFADVDEDAVARARDRLSRYDVRENVAIYVGGLEPIYNIELMLEAFEDLDDWSLVVAGTGSLESAVAEAHDGEAVIFLETVPHEDVPGYLHEADVGLSLVDDPHTLKVLEYGAASLPVVQLTGRANERFGSLLTYCNPSPTDVAAAVDSATTSDGRRLRDAVEDFDWENIARTYVDVITSVK